MNWIVRGANLLAGALLAVSTGLMASEPNHGVVLQYHHVDDSTPHSTSTRLKDFRAHLEYIDNNGFTVWPLPRLVQALKNREPVPDRVVAITFDDAYASVYEQAFPLLKERDWPFTIFVSTEFVDAGGRLSLSWDQLREMVAANAVVGNHTVTHLHMPRLLEGEDEATRTQRLREEIEQAQARIDAELGEQPRLFAYPYGEVDPQTQQLVETLGYAAFGQQSGAMGELSDFGFLPRFPSSGAYAGKDNMALKLWSLPLPVLAETPSSMILEEGDDIRPSLELQLAPGNYRAHQLACFASGQGRVPVEVDDIELDGETAVRLRARAEQDVLPGRSRYNCTAPDRRGKRFYWYSKPWLRTGYWD
ncbi:polysaccharide deacetylase family protein [Aestuariirhabdus sp. Z084]|uniref:polysaccharide deacetylase family protein n=1 Tax=Aestuariirhabdus haliotis TaxID=2918751 RepID=UPI00201B35F7|nr:polysaccharide deacetylase family protein [Aestuariirhabdus haliotis]MCL6416989.1 polysaccharide deacetylase family protein [Aestuariirhabdus haliotis]MCL6421004.1 polysaccharide deacetylase family protein [Aestuariirhabdus haliotis]